MASVHRDKRNKAGVWYCSYLRRDGKRVWRSTGSKIKSEAKIICQAWQSAEDEAGRGELSQSRVAAILNETLQRTGAAQLERPKANVYLDDWLATKDKIGVSLRRHYRFVVTRFCVHLAQIHPNQPLLLEQVSARDVAGFLAALKAEGRAPATLNRIRRNLSTPFERARRLGLIRFNPVSLVDPEKNDHIRRISFTAQEVAQLARAATGTDWEGLVLLGYGSGLRLGDGANLRWSDIDLEFGVINFRQRKTSAVSVIGLHPDFSDWLGEQSRTPEQPDAFVFPTLAGRETSGRKGLSSEFTALMDRAGLIDLKMRKAQGTRGKTLRSRSFHSFRHGAASQVFNSALAKEAARRLTAHSGEALQRYLHADLEGIRAATALIPRLPKK
jgi:integrase